MEFVESSVFSKDVHDYLDDNEYSALQWCLALNPEAGDLIPRSGGLRKMRWTGKGKGERGCLRIIYYYKTKQGEIWFLTIYAKNETENIPAHILQKLRKELIP